MKTILVPCDFSAPAQNALLFAIVIAKKLQARIVLLNAFQAPMMVTATPAAGLFTREFETLKRASENKLRTLAITIEHAGGIPYDLLADEGDTVKVIERNIRLLSPDLVIMGTRGGTDTGQLIFGSITSDIIERSPRPVIAVPVSSVFSKPVKKITYATDYLQSDIPALLTIVEIAAALGASVNILHIATDEVSGEEESTMMGTFMRLVERHIDYPHLSFEVLNGEDVSDKLEEYIASGVTDMIVLSTQYRNYFGRLFGESITRTLVSQTNIPLLAFHYRKESSVRVY